MNCSEHAHGNFTMAAHFMYFCLLCVPSKPLTFPRLGAGTVARVMGLTGTCMQRRRADERVSALRRNACQPRSFLVRCVLRNVIDHCKIVRSHSAFLTLLAKVHLHVLTIRKIVANQPGDATRVTRVDIRNVVGQTCICPLQDSTTQSHELIIRVANHHSRRTALAC